MKGRIILVILGTALAAGIVAMASAFGMPALFVSAWVLSAVAIGIITRQTLLTEDTAWPPAEPEEVFRGSEVSRLAWAVNARSGVVGLALVRRLENALRHRAAAHGLDLDDPADAAKVEELFGPGMRTILQSRVVHRRDVERVLAALESVPPTLERR